jgi:calcineurin-like phosphoesterase family protein
VIDNAKLMIERHNATINNEDFVIMVGDLSAGLKGRYDHFQSLLKLLKGRKILIRGNHDHCDDLFYMDAGFIDVVEYMTIGDTFFCHYPCYESKWNKGKEPKFIKILKKSGCENIIHGHCHNKDPSTWEPDGFWRMNVSVDFAPNNYYPLELEQPEIKEYLIKRYGK